MPTVVKNIAPPLETECAACRNRLNERLVSNSGHWLVMRYICPKCDFSTIRHIERPIPANPLEALIAGSEDQLV
jgi:hypothetical protein